MLTTEPPEKKGKAVGRDFQAGQVASLFTSLKNCNDEAIRTTGDIDVSALVTILSPVLSDEKSRAAVIPALAFFIGSALDGSIVDMTTWTPPPSSK